MSEDGVKDEKSVDGATPAPRRAKTERRKNR